MYFQHNTEGSIRTFERSHSDGPWIVHPPQVYARVSDCVRACQYIYTYSYLYTSLYIYTTYIYLNNIYLSIYLDIHTHSPQARGAFVTQGLLFPVEVPGRGFPVARVWLCDHLVEEKCRNVPVMATNPLA